MEDIEKILIDNLKEILKSAQTYLLTGTVASIFLLLLAYQGRFNQPNEENVGVPFVGLSAPTSAAASIAFGIYFISGIIVLILDNSCRRIEGKLRQSKTKGLLNAVLTYPSLIRPNKSLGGWAAFITFLFAVGAMVASWYQRHGISPSSLVPAIVLASPYLLLSLRLWSRLLVKQWNFDLVNTNKAGEKMNVGQRVTGLIDDNAPIKKAVSISVGSEPIGFPPPDVAADIIRTVDPTSPVTLKGKVLSVEADKISVELGFFE